MDEYGDELYLDLKQFWGFDLASFLGGEVLSSCRLIFTMIRGLPEGSRYAALRAKDVDAGGKDIKLTAEEERFLDAQTWTFDRRLWAMITNAINQNTIATGGPWKDGKAPEFQIVGPVSWDPKRKKRLDAKERVESGNWDNWDVARALGWAPMMAAITPQDD